ncbi:conserved hypothetical protein [Neospora caninum Liverpool]|uniref:S-adenosyl-L-methionine-dependent methyltransferase, putative n=1 Tax=Neospora caninum (strain Liverpool) TaxID=572307 RepID=F0V7J1_NEOCL|nr:conserved hypothetical protein [Neospora caninum Liverpool]CBZ49682.1 conserved hypothetical protein [Neospora caninum Liverpool]CEL64266.1 TPA: S-adenosyl-L-methionine-dependent methyltransferase, putative [Neospora caninum Liverpool]|eukprot:XP_003879717.1 conserved hypothetical protein [Neospora caninum Liverpool]
MTTLHHSLHTGGSPCPCCSRPWEELPDFNPNEAVSLAKGEPRGDGILRVSGVVSRARKLSSRLLFADVSWPPTGASGGQDGGAEAVTCRSPRAAIRHASLNTTTSGFPRGEEETCSRSPVGDWTKRDGTKEMEPSQHSVSCTDRGWQENNFISPDEGEAEHHAAGHDRKDNLSEPRSTKTEADPPGGCKTQLVFDFAAFVGICRNCFARRIGLENGPESNPSDKLCFAQTQATDTSPASSSVDGRAFPQDVRHTLENTCQPPEAIFRSLCALLLHAGCQLCVAGNPIKTKSGHLSLSVTVVTYVQAPPTFEALNRLCKSVQEATLPLEALIASTTVGSRWLDCSGTTQGKSLFHQLLQSTAQERKPMLKRLCRRLTDRPLERMRPPTFVAEDLATLDFTKLLRTEWPISDYFDNCLHSTCTAAVTGPQKQAKPTASSTKKAADMQEYMTHKKGPQVRWMIQQIRHLYESLHSRQISTPSSPRLGSKETETKIRCLDVGGGRGDLAFALATSFPQLHVTVLDINATSLAAARLRAEDAEIPNIDFVCEDFSQYEISSDTKLIVGLHSCGGLADSIISSAMALGVSFVVSTCCFCKHPHLRMESLVKQLHELRNARSRTAVGEEERPEPQGAERLNPEHSTVVKDRHPVVLSYPEPRLAGESQMDQVIKIEPLLPRLCKLAESSDRAVSLAAMHAVNAWRLACVNEISRQRVTPDLSGCELPPRNPLYGELCIKAFAQEYSPKNLVLVGVVRSLVK